MVISLESDAYLVLCHLATFIRSSGTPTRKDEPGLRTRPRSLSSLGELLKNLSDAASAHGQATLANGERRTAFQRDRRDQLNIEIHVVARHHHFNAIWQRDRAGDIHGADVKLRTVTGEKGLMTPAFITAQHINFALEFLVRRYRTDLGDNHTALNFLAANASQQNAGVVGPLAPGRVPC